MAFLDRIRRTFAGGDDELGREDLLRRIEEGILALKRHGARGKEVFPAGVHVRITAAEGSLDTLRAFVADTGFERDLEARLLNRLSDAGAFPARRYEVAAGERTAVVVEEDTSGVSAVLEVIGGDRDGDRFPVELGRREWRIGRGRWHQERPDDQRLPNDIPLTESAAFVSRAAALLRRSGAFLEVESRQQGEFLVVVRKDGAMLRPAMTASGRIAVGPGDRIEFHDGGNGRIVLRIAPPC
jgi:hypothetical protein